MQNTDNLTPLQVRNNTIQQLTLTKNEQDEIDKAYLRKDIQQLNKFKVDGINRAIQFGKFILKVNPQTQEDKNIQKIFQIAYLQLYNKYCKLNNLKGEAITPETFETDPVKKTLLIMIDHFKKLPLQTINSNLQLFKRSNPDIDFNNIQQFANAVFETNISFHSDLFTDIFPKNDNRNFDTDVSLAIKRTKGKQMGLFIYQIARYPIKLIRFIDANEYIPTKVELNHKHKDKRSYIKPLTMDIKTSNKEVVDELQKIFEVKSASSLSTYELKKLLLKPYRDTRKEKRWINNTMPLESLQYHIKNSSFALSKDSPLFQEYKSTFVQNGIRPASLEWLLTADAMVEYKSEYDKYKRPSSGKEVDLFMELMYKIPADYDSDPDIYKRATEQKMASFLKTLNVKLTNENIKELFALGISPQDLKPFLHAGTFTDLESKYAQTQGIMKQCDAREKSTIIHRFCANIVTSNNRKLPVKNHITSNKSTPMQRKQALELEMESLAPHADTSNIAQSSAPRPPIAGKKIPQSRIVSDASEDITTSIKSVFEKHKDKFLVMGIKPSRLEFLPIDILENYQNEYEEEAELDMFITYSEKEEKATIDALKQEIEACNNPKPQSNEAKQPATNLANESTQNHKASTLNVSDTTSSNAHHNSERPSEAVEKIHTAPTSLNTNSASYNNPERLSEVVAKIKNSKAPALNTSAFTPAQLKEIANRTSNSQNQASEKSTYFKLGENSMNASNSRISFKRHLDPASDTTPSKKPALEPSSSESKLTRISNAFGMPLKRPLDQGSNEPSSKKPAKPFSGNTRPM